MSYHSISIRGICPAEVAICPGLIKDEPVLFTGVRPALCLVLVFFFNQGVDGWGARA